MPPYFQQVVVGVLHGLLAWDSHLCCDELPEFVVGPRLGHGLDLIASEA